MKIQKNETKEFWNSLLTEKSWSILQELKREYDFVLIGGWAVYLLTRQLKSKDIDIVITIDTLARMKDLGISKNDALKKYEIKKEEIDIDVYVEYFSQLTVPVHEIKKHTLMLEGFRVARPELLVLLKQGAYHDREYAVKGEKDKIDILFLLFFSHFDSRKYCRLAERYHLMPLTTRLQSLVQNFKDFNALSLTPRSFKLKKAALLKSLSHIR